MRIIITGGYGFIGSAFVNYLRSQHPWPLHTQILIVDKLTYAADKGNVTAPNVNFLHRDICDVTAEELGEYDYLVHFAAESHVDNSIKDGKPFIRTNVEGTFNLLECAKQNKSLKKFIHISTDEVYGDILIGRSKENDSYKPSSPYAASKASSDHLVYSYVRTFKIPAIVTNCSNNYGPKQHPEKLIPKLIYNILNNKSLPIYGNGKNSREWIYVEDHCEALLKVFQKGKIGEFYNIGSNKNLNNLEICKYLIRVAKEKIKIGKNVKIEFVKDRPGHDVRYALDSKKILNRLGWKTKMNFKKGLEKTFLWYLKNEKYYKSISKTDIVKRVGKI